MRTVATPRARGATPVVLPLVAAAAAFAVITGAHDGASLIATNLSSKAMRPPWLPGL
jgi:phosphate/sulfate permease